MNVNSCDQSIVYHCGLFTDKPAPPTTSCSGEWSAPSGDYKAIWAFDEASSKITFTLEATLSGTGRWMAIGMNSQPKMVFIIPH